LAKIITINKCLGCKYLNAEYKKIVEDLRGGELEIFPVKGEES